MSQENVDVVRAQFAALGHGGLEAVTRFWHPDIEWRAIEGALDDVGVMRGEDAVRRYYQDWLDTVDHLQVDVVEVIAEAGEQVVVVVRNSGRGRVSGAPSSGRYYVACIVRDGRIASGREYATREQALEAAGLRE
jgi:ketosteroid isomerase-like protein